MLPLNIKRFGNRKFSEPKLKQDVIEIDFKLHSLCLHVLYLIKISLITRSENKYYFNRKF